MLVVKVGVGVGGVDMDESVPVPVPADVVEVAWGGLVVFVRRVVIVEVPKVVFEGRGVAGRDEVGEDVFEAGLLDGGEEDGEDGMGRGLVEVLGGEERIGSPLEVSEGVGCL